MTDVATRPESQRKLVRQIEDALGMFLDEQLEVMTAIDNALAEVEGALRQSVLSGGKRLRPQFAYWAGRAAGADDCPALRSVAASLELFQAFALVHDDIMDRSTLRRGRPAAHVMLADMHTSRSWKGDSADFGMANAILVGDVLLVLAEKMVDSTDLNPNVLASVRSVYREMQVELMVGQFLDGIAQARGSATLEQALKVVTYKSAKYTVEAPTHLGAALAQASPDWYTVLSEFAIPVGEAFQLRDDVLGVFGDESVTGKPSGEDVREGKQTPLIVEALARSTSSQRLRLGELIGSEGIDRAGLADARGIIVETGALAQIEAMIDERADRGLGALARVPADADRGAVTQLSALGATAAHRSR